MKKQLPFKFTQSLFRMTAFIVFTLLTVQSSFAQKWNVIGDETKLLAPSNNSWTSTSITVVGDVPYVAYIDGGTTGTARVKKMNTDGTWSDVGSGGTPFSGSVGSVRIFNNNGKLYVAGTNKNAPSVLIVSILDTTVAIPAWARTTISTNPATYTGPSDTRFDIAFATDGTPYIAYSERPTDLTSGYPWVKRLVNGVWETVGTGAVQTTNIFTAAIDIALDANNVPYLVYVNQALYNSGGPDILKAYRYVNSNWEDITPLDNLVGTTSIASTRYANITMDADNNPVVCYFNYSNKNKSTIIRYDKSASVWDSPIEVSTRDAYNPYLINDAAGNLYNIFADALISGGLSSTVRVFKKANGTSVFNELENLPISSPSGVGIDANGPNDNTARTIKIANLSIAVGSNTSKPYIVYTKTNASGVVAPVVRVFDPLITTTAVNAITATGATVGGELLTSAPAVGTVTERGVVCATAVNPATDATFKFTDVTATAGVFTGSISGLEAATPYYARAYFIYSDGTNSYTVYGDNKKFTTAASLATNTFEKTNLVKAYPNPTTDSVTVSLPNGAVVEKISVYNSLGQLLFTEAKNTVSLQHLAKGNYFLTIYTSEENFSKKIIKK